MSVNVSFAGNTYPLPSVVGENGWGANLTTFLQAVASNAATSTIQKQSIRTALTTPVTLTITDYAVAVKLTTPAAVSAVLPAGSTGIIYSLIDATGDAKTNPITITCTSGQLINGAASYVINENFGGVVVQFDGTGWKIQSDFVGRDPTFETIKITSLSTGLLHSDASGNITSSLLVNADVSASAAIGLSKLAAVTASKALVSDASGFVSPSAVTTTELGHLVGVTSAVQTQITNNLSTLTTHTGAASGVHGIVGAVVGSSDSQTLTNKTLTSPVINTPTGIVKGDVGLGNVDNTSDATKNAATATLTNKTISGATNTVTNVSLTAGVTGTLPVANGGTNLTAIGTALQVLRVNAGATALEYAAAAGDVSGPASATTNAVAKFSGTTGKIIQNSGVVIDASDNVSGIGTLSTTGAATLGAASATTSHTVNGKQIALTVNNTTADMYLNFANSSDTQGYVGAQGTTGTSFAGRTLAQSVTAGDLMLITKGGSRGIVFGTSTATTIDIVGRFAGTGALSLLANAAVGLSLKRTDASGAGPFTMQDFVDGAGDVCGRIQIDASANTASYVTSSDARLKTNIRGFDALAMVAAVSPSLYDRHSGSVNEYGFMAQSLADVLPQAVSAGSIAGPAEEGFEAWGIDYGKLTPILWKAVQELKAELDITKAQIAALQKL